MSRDMVDGEIGLRASVRDWTFFCSLSGSRYADKAIPDDDANWLSAHALAAFQLTTDTELRLGTTITRTSYDSRLTDAAWTDGSGDTQEGTRMELRPGITIVLSPVFSVWGEVFVESYRANDPYETSQGAGTLAGLNAWLTRKWLAGIWIQGTLQDYVETTTDGVTDQDPSSVPLGLSTSYRVYPWLDLLASGQYGYYQQRDETTAYSAWKVQAGLRMTFEVP